MNDRGNRQALAAYLAGEPVAICAQGGGNRTVSIVGMLDGLSQAKRTAKAYVGVSSGACAIAGHMTGEDGATFETYVKLARDKCIALQWILTWYGWVPMLTFDREKLIQELERQLSIPRIENHPSHFGITTLEYETGRGEILDGKTDVLNKLRATVSLPNLCEPVVIDGKLRVDGISVRVTPAIRKYWARNVIILRARRRWWFEDVSYPYFAHYGLFDKPASLRWAVAAADYEFEQEVMRLRSCSRIRVWEVEPDEDDPFIWPWTCDVKLLRRMRDNAREYVLRCMDEVGRSSSGRAA